MASSAIRNTWDLVWFIVIPPAVAPGWDAAQII